MKNVSRKFLPVLAVLLIGLPLLAGGALAQDDDVDMPEDAVPAAVSLDPPPLPKLDKAEWKTEKTVFNGALYVSDAQNNTIGDPLDLPGTQYTAHLEYQRQADSLDDDLMDRIASDYQKTLSGKGFDYQIPVPDTSWQIAGVISDSSDGGVSGQVAIVGGNLRFIAVRTSESGGDIDENAPPQPASAKTTVSGDIEIFVSDVVPVSDLVKKATAQEKAGTQ